jgi:hypothetical protein
MANQTSAVPTGTIPAVKSKRMLATVTRIPNLANRVRHNSKPHTVRVRMKLVGTTKKPMIFDVRKYIEASKK